MANNIRNANSFASIINYDQMDKSCDWKNNNQFK